jgi:hypothetical protein
MDSNMSENLPIRFDDVYRETEPIAVIKLQPQELEQKNKELKFQKGYDDLDYLEYVRFEVMPGCTVALISHENTPIPGTDICVDPERLDIVSILIKTIQQLHLFSIDLSWIHPDSARTSRMYGTENTSTIIAIADRFSFPARKLSQQLLEHIESGKIGYWEHQFDLLAGEAQSLRWNLCIANGQILYSDHRLWSIESLMKVIHRYLPHIRNDSSEQRLEKLSSYAEQHAQSPAALFAEIQKIGIVNNVQLQKAMKTKILNDLDTYLLMGSGNAQFIPDRETLSQFPIEGLNPTILLDEARQRQLSWEKLQEYVPSMNSIPILNRQALAKANLPAGQKERIESLVQSQQTLNSVATSMAKDTLEVADMFAKLAKMDLVSFQVPKSNTPAHSIYSGEINASTPKF